MGIMCIVPGMLDAARYMQCSDLLLLGLTFGHDFHNSQSMPKSAVLVSAVAYCHIKWVAGSDLDLTSKTLGYVEIQGGLFP